MASRETSTRRCAANAQGHRRRTGDSPPHCGRPGRLCDVHRLVDLLRTIVKSDVTSGASIFLTSRAFYRFGQKWRAMADIIDPTLRPNPSISRSVFVGLSTGAIAAAIAIERALAGGATLGAPHPPLVSEDDPDIRVERPSLTRPGGTIDAYAALPAGRGADRMNATYRKLPTERPAAFRVWTEEQWTRPL